MTNVSKGYKEDDIRAFLPRLVRNVENAEARMQFLVIENQKTICFWFFLLKSEWKQFTKPFYEIYGTIFRKQ